MRKIVLVAAIAAGALSLAACSESTEDAAGEAADSAMADAEANTEAAADAVGDAAAEAGDAVDAAADATDEAATEVEADAQDGRLIGFRQETREGRGREAAPFPFGLSSRRPPRSTTRRSARWRTAAPTGRNRRGARGRCWRSAPRG